MIIFCIIEEQLEVYKNYLLIRSFELKFLVLNIIIIIVRKKIEKCQRFKEIHEIIQNSFLSQLIL